MKAENPLHLNYNEVLRRKPRPLDISDNNSRLGSWRSDQPVKFQTFRNNNVYNTKMRIQEYIRNKINVSITAVCYSTNMHVAGTFKAYLCFVQIR